MAAYKNEITEYNGIEFQTQYYIQHELCAYPGCNVMLFWEGHGSENDGQCFKVDQKCYCEQPEEVYSCSRHLNEIDYWKCSECN